MGVVLLGYAVLGLTGFGSALVIVPLLAWRWPLPEVVALTLLMDVPASALHSGLNWRQVQWRELRRLLPGLLVGTLLGLWLVQHLQAQALIGAQPWLLNINIPNAPVADILPAKVCRLGRRHAAEKVITQVNPRGETMYWIGSAGEAMDDGEGTDFHATRQGHIAITPLQVDLTDHEGQTHWGRAFAQPFSLPIAP